MIKTRHLFAFVFLSMLTAPTWAQDRTQTLADIRQEMSVLYVEIQKLKRELSTTGGVSGLDTGGSVLDRMGAIEGELARLTSKTEQLEFRIDKVVRDGTNRLGDLEFRLCELEVECDIGTLSEGSTLGGVEPAVTGTDYVTDVTTGADDDGPQLAIGEQADFEAAKAAFNAGAFEDAATQFGAFQINYPDGPLSDMAALFHGQALEGAGDQTGAARVFLEIFSANPNGSEAPEALFLLGRALGNLGQTDEACVTLAEVGIRFPGGLAAQNAEATMQTLGCQ